MKFFVLTATALAFALPSMVFTSPINTDLTAVASSSIVSPNVHVHQFRDLGSSSGIDSLLVSRTNTLGVTASPGLKKRDNICVDLCTESDYNVCFYNSCFAPGQCATLGFTNSFLQNAVSSIKIPDYFHCRIWAGKNCGGASVDVHWYKSSNLADLKFNNRMESYKCWKEGEN
jgi:hypothetical protein